MTTSTSALSKLSTSCRAGGRAAAGVGASAAAAGGVAAGGTPDPGGAGAAVALSGSVSVAGGAGAMGDGGTGARGMDGGSVVTSTRGRPGSAAGPPAVDVPGGGAAEAQPAASPTTRSQHAARLEAVIAAPLARWAPVARAQAPPARGPGRPDQAQGQP